jgi:hypothetical protein
MQGHLIGEEQMSTKANPGEYDCWSKASDDEEMFILLGRDRHAGALVRLWAEMREREGEDPLVVEEARDCAERMEGQARTLSKPVMNMDSLVMFATTLRAAKEAAMAAPTAPEAVPTGYGLAAGEIVMVGHGGPAKLLRVFPEDHEKEELRGHANVQFPRATGPVTVEALQLRRAMPDEVEQYRLAGGRL